MTSPVLRRLTLGFATLASVGLLSAPAALAQTRTTVTGLSENQGLIRACRQTNRSIEVFDDTELKPTNRIGTLPAGTQVRLTGVVATGRAQIFRDSPPLSTTQPVGWVDAAFLTTCGGSPPPATKACFRANQELRVRATPSTSANILAGYKVGDTVYASTNPPTRQQPGDGRTWMQVAFGSQTGWVAETNAGGQPGNLTSISCP
ncbi:MAG TPA: hypothetical protein IGR64_02470 [Leptolyngbyaceae cyanobacterium M65_K2018_010]|nr:hypothetical protein [Leptolyngbyaceae cyanobacterium M65_K2018_010]